MKTSSIYIPLHKQSKLLKFIKIGQKGAMARIVDNNPRNGRLTKWQQ